MILLSLQTNTDAMVFVFGACSSVSPCVCVCVWMAVQQMNKRLWRKLSCCSAHCMKQRPVLMRLQRSVCAPVLLGFLDTFGGFKGQN